MIDKNYINFYSNWHYKKIDNDYQACEKGKNNVGVITQISKCPIEEFIKKLSKIGGFKKSLNFTEKEMEIISNKYPWIKSYHKEILLSKIRKPIILSLFVTAIENEDFDLSNYILIEYGLTEFLVSSWKLDTLYKHDSVFLEEVKYGDSFYSIANDGDLIAKTIIYKEGNKDCVINGVRYFLSDELIKQLKEAKESFDKSVKDVFNQKNGYTLVRFGDGRYIGYKRLASGGYHFVVIKKTQDALSYIYQSYTSCISFLKKFDFKRWGFLSSSPDDIKEYSLPLYNSAKETGDKFLEYEIKYVTKTATLEEIDYLNKNDFYEKRDRFYFKKNFYDLEDVDVLNACSRIVRWAGRVIECEMIIEGRKFLVRYEPHKLNKNKVSVYSKDEQFILSISDKVIERINEVLKISEN